MLILLINNSKYGIGFFNGFCLTDGCQVKSVEIKNSAKSFIKVVKEESPELVFINVKLAIQILRFAESTEKLLFLRENNISLCAIGKFPPHYDKSVFKTLFEKNFIEPFNSEEIKTFITSKMFAISERRSSHRRGMMERRKHNERLESSSSRINSFLEKTPTVFDITDDSTLSSYGSDIPLKITDVQNINSDLKQRLRLGPLSIDYSEKSILINDAPVKISPKEFKLIELLTIKHGHLVQIEEIIKKVWGESKNATKADVHQYMYMLRRKLEKDPCDPHLIVTVKGFGYKLGL